MCNGVCPDGHRRPSTNALSPRSSPAYDDEHVDDEGLESEKSDSLSMVVIHWELYLVLIERCGRFCISGRALLLFLCARFGCKHPREIDNEKFYRSDRLIHSSQFLIVSVLR
jgi:hypothetical protein